MKNDTLLCFKICFSLILRDLEYVFICLEDIYISFSLTCLFKLFAYFLLSLFNFALVRTSDFLLCVLFTFVIGNYYLLQREANSDPGLELFL